jgi:hypothetical protein
MNLKKAVSVGSVVSLLALCVSCGGSSSSSNNTGSSCSSVLAIGQPDPIYEDFQISCTGCPTCHAPETDVPFTVTQTDPCTLEVSGQELGSFGGTVKNDEVTSSSSVSGTLGSLNLTVTSYTITVTPASGSATTSFSGTFNWEITNDTSCHGTVTMTPSAG